MTIFFFPAAGAAPSDHLAPVCVVVTPTHLCVALQDFSWSLSGDKGQSNKIGKRGPQFQLKDRQKLTDITVLVRVALWCEQMGLILPENTSFSYSLSSLSVGLDIVNKRNIIAQISRCIFMKLQQKFSASDSVHTFLCKIQY